MKRLRQIAVSFFWAILFWESFALIMAWEMRVRALQQGSPPDYWRYTLIQTGTCLTFAILTPAIFFVVRRYPVTRQNRVKRVTAYIAGAVPFIAVFSCLRWLILPVWSSAEQRFLPRTPHSLLFTFASFADQSWTYLATVVAAHASAYMRERVELLQAVAASELQALRSQIHPHFLFNTLHGISTLIDRDQAKAKAMIVMLAGLLRTALKQGQADLVSLQEELRFLENYVAIEKIRLGDRLEVRWDISAETGGLLVPQLILQPLVENAIVHGISCCREGGWLQVASRRKGLSLEIQISNSMCGARQQPGVGLGLQNTKGRLQYLYGDEASFEFTTHDDHFAMATLTLPAFRAAAPERAELQHTMMEGRDARFDRG